TGYSINDDETRATIKSVYQQYNYLPDPHGAVGYLALERYLQEHANEKGIFLETAHPVKFYDVVESVVGEPVPVPDTIKAQLQLQKQSSLINPDYEALKTLLLNRY